MVSTLLDRLEQQCLQDTILEVRASGMKKMPGLEIETGIDKQVIQGPIKLSKIGLTGDEHDLTFHGGPDKAILGYCKAHYPSWQESFPERIEQFVPGGFGENFVFTHMNERNVCIGDVVSVGSEAVMEVSLPRMPCFKLNHRFSLKNFAPKTYQTSRTGWYYRVLKEGHVQAGDKVKVIDRPYPDWPIYRIQEYLHRNTENLAMNEALSAIEALGNESRNQFKNRVEKSKKAQEESNVVWTDFKVQKRAIETKSVVSLNFEAVEPAHDAEKIPLASHVSIRLPSGLVRSYSIVGSESGNKFQLGVLLDANSRGGSKEVHQAILEGSTVPVRITRRGFDDAGAASNHCFIVGGIGVTAFLRLMETAFNINYSFKMHYGVRSDEEIPFKTRLDRLGKNVVYYNRSKGQRMNIEEIIKALPWNSHVYVCGPQRMMDGAQAAIKKAGLGDSEVHFEAFQADISGDPFEARVLNRGDKSLQISGTESLLQVLRREFGDDIASSCEVGNCGTCKVKLKSGRVQHKGTALSAEEKEDNMLSCISRGVGKVEIEI